MSDILQADIFFFIASFATVVFCIIVAMVLFQIYKITALIRRVLEKLESATEVVAEDVANIRELVATGGFVSSIVGLIMGTKKRRKKKTTEETEI